MNEAHRCQAALIHTHYTEIPTKGQVGAPIIEGTQTQSAEAAG